MAYNTQNDKRWADDSMGLPTDRMKLWGCLVTAIANIHNMLPGELNLQLKEYKGYNGLTNHPVKNHESFIEWEIAEKILNFKHIDSASFGNDMDHVNFYIARIIHRTYNTGHYVNVISSKKNEFKLFDTDFGDTKTYDRNRISKFIKIIKLG